MMKASLSSRLRKAWNVFMRGNDDVNRSGYGDSYRPDRVRLSRGNERTIVTSIINRIAMDVSAVSIRHVRLDHNGRYAETIDSNLNRCFNLEANIDQTGRAFVQDIVMSMLDEGCVAVVPVDTSGNPEEGTYEIYTMRTGQITEWFPRHIKTLVYNERKGKKEEIKISKSSTAIIENPLYAVMNEPNSTLQRLARKLALLDAVDEQSSSGKLDLIIQVPYTIRSDARKQQAEGRREAIEKQLSGSKYGIAYTDATEKIVQLNRPIENNLMHQVEYLTNMAFSQIGITQSILDGTADEQTMLNYNNRVIEPILSAIVDEAKRKFLTRTAITQMQSIIFLREPFRLVPVSQLAEIGDKFIRNEILSANDVRQIIGMVPSKDPSADQLKNPNIKNKEEIDVKETDEIIDKKEDTKSK